MQSLRLNYGTNCNSNRKSQYNNVSNKIIFAQHEKNGDDEGETKYKNQKPRINLYHITCNDCGKGNYAGNNECSTQTKPKEDVEQFRKMKE